MHINPDHYLQTKQGRVISPKLNEKAWLCCFQALQDALSSATIKNTYLLIGCQASGKSTWAEQHLALHPNDLIFDAILVKKSERKPILTLIKRANLPCTAVWFQLPLELCLIRNALRAPDEKVNVQGLINVHGALEAPSLEEGFDHILDVYKTCTKLT